MLAALTAITRSSRDGDFKEQVCTSLYHRWVVGSPALSVLAKLLSEFETITLS